LSPKREMLGEIQYMIDFCIKEITELMQEYGYFYDVDPKDVKEVYGKYKNICKEIPVQARSMLEDCLFNCSGRVRKLEKQFINYKKICSKFKYPNDRNPKK